MIDVLENEKTFHLKTEHTSFILHIIESGHPVCLYWGRKVSGNGFSYIVKELKKASYLAWTDGRKDLRLEQYPLLYPVYGYPDLRNPAVHIRYENGSRITDLRYKGYRISKGKQKIPGLPAVTDPEADVLELILEDNVRHIECTLVFGVFGEYDAFTQSVILHNNGRNALTIEKIMSSCFSFLEDDLECVTLTGAWARECHLSRERLRQGTFRIDSRRGAGGHGQNPFLGLARPDCSQNNGGIYGMNLVYSGSFEASAEVDMHQNTRVMMGIQSFDFAWQLSPGESFYTPEAVLVYSDSGMNGMSHIFHRLYRERLMKNGWGSRPRPVVINNWEATYFDFDRDKLLALAKEAAEIGVEMFVLDDGWFGCRNSENESLGDWTENYEKLGGTLSGLADELERLGLKFGIWMEPEMVSPDSDLFREHPDWIIASPEYTPQLARNQYVLDLSKKCVRDYIVKAVSDILKNGKISYIKWDMNRNITDAFSQGGAAEHQQELHHRYILGLYDILEQLTGQFPDVLFEGCAGGGGRYDPGMLYYMPQIWASDDTDAIERLAIQQGTSLIYPAVSMSCHVSAVPNHQVGRTTSLKTRGITAMQGMLGYELDLTKCTDEEKQALAEQIAEYKSLRDLIGQGRMYRLETTGYAYAWMFVSEDKREAYISYVQVLTQPNTVPKRLRLVGLEEEGLYCLAGTDQIRTGSQWVHCGVGLPGGAADFCGRTWRLYIK